MSLIAKSLLSLLAVGGIAAGQKAVLDHTSEPEPYRATATHVRTEPVVGERNSTAPPPRSAARTTTTVEPPPFDPVNGVYGQMPVATKAPITYGATGDNVAYMQAVLRFAAGQPIEIDGIFGPETAGAVYNLQTFWGLSLDGTINADDWGVIDFLASS